MLKMKNRFYIIFYKSIIMYTINKIFKKSFLINRSYVREFKRPIVESDLDLKKFNKLFEKYKKSIYDVENEKG